MKTSKLVFISLLVAQGVVLSLIESLLPPLFSFAPGAKLGLANLITLTALFTTTKRETFLIISLRLLLATLLGGTISTLMYSVVGAYLSFVAMCLIKPFIPKYCSLIGLSAVGGFMHNVGQLIVASLIARTWTVMLYLPVLAFSGLLAGIALGCASYFLLTHIKHLKYYINQKI